MGAPKKVPDLSCLPFDKPCERKLTYKGQLRSDYFLISVHESINLIPLSLEKQNTAKFMKDLNLRTVYQEDC